MTSDSNSDQRDTTIIAPRNSARNLGRLLVYAACRLVLALLGRVPRRFGVFLIDAVAWVAWRVLSRHRRISEVNLRIAFPGMPRDERSRTARTSFTNMVRNVLELARLRCLTPENAGLLVSYDAAEGLANFEAARRQGRGILYMTGHFSAWELLPAAHAVNGHPLSFVTRPLDNPYLDRFVQHARRTGGNEVISKKNAARRILENLKRGGSVGILMDQNTRIQEGTWAPLFGVPAATTTSIALFALRTGAPVLPGFIVPNGRFRYTIKFLPPVEMTRSGDLERDVQENTEQLNRVLEDFIRRHPDAWLWVHKRWKYQPPGNPPDLYALRDSDLDRFLAGRRPEP